ncbi:hypothetical protein [Embleya sp. NBC_00896]|uniref:hypothetical protein n=1 Tax=Embleya sp. NBC_00896 TaxID=2975961 RepID=UPI00386BB0A3|nr:hypothetical protein OG928_48055 [Embleya sp. NBC_00896]
MARKRPRRTRNKRVSPRAALALSSLHPRNLDLSHPEVPSLVCPDCRTWCPIVGRATPKLGPHDTEEAGSAPAHGCDGTNRLLDVDLVDFDAAVAEWEQRLANPTPGPVSGCDTYEQHKLKARATRRTPEPAYKDYAAHREACTSCTGSTRCPKGEALAGILRFELSADVCRLRMAELGSSVASRRATKVLPKPVAQVPLPVSEMRPGPHTPEAAEQAYTAHRDRCPGCTDTMHCPTGETLHHTLTRLISQEPRKVRGRETLEEFSRELEQERARRFPRRRKKEWAKVSRSVERTDLRRTLAFAVRVHLGVECAQLCDESLWLPHKHGGASMHIAEGRRLILHRDAGFTLASSSSRIEEPVTADTVGIVLAILADEQA